MEEIASITLIAYCLKYGLKAGDVSDACVLSICQSTEFEVIETFNFVDFKEVGSGFLGVDYLKRGFC